MTEPCVMSTGSLRRCGRSPNVYSERTDALGADDVTHDNGLVE